ncbi:hypothetical protein ABT072_28630 [Streptomyces sp. NPDC002589]|uniref:hypothetical protein n=1 Tax=Streptomyces sp. NPDC002589 TaxID=3154420 RepID=UPI00332B743E
MRRDLQRRLFERLRARPLPVDQHARPLGLDFAVLTAAVVAGVAAASALLGRLAR